VIPDSAGIVHACYGPNGQLRVIDSSTETCKPSETPLEWDTKVRGSRAVESSGGASLGAANYTTVADLTLPAGNYCVIATANAQNLGSAHELVACNLDAAGAPSLGSASETLIPATTFSYASLAIAGTVHLPAGGVVELRCILGTDTGAGPVTAGGKIVATSVAEVAVQP
jgi:hypothetical protein